MSYSQMKNFIVCLMMLLIHCTENFRQTCRIQSMQFITRLRLVVRQPPRKLQTDLQDTEYATESTIHNLIKTGGQTAPQKLQTDLQDTEYTIHNLIKVGGQTAPLPSPEKWVVEKDAGKKCRCRCR